MSAQTRAYVRSAGADREGAERRSAERAERERAAAERATERAAALGPAPEPRDEYDVFAEIEAARMAAMIDPDRHAEVMASIDEWEAER
jgi:hypothetical protein